MIVRRLVDGIDERLDATSFIKHNLRKVFPDHWSFMLGELALYSFVMLLLTGIFLSLFFVASPAETIYRGPYLPMQGREVSLAYESVLRLSFEVRAGLVMRQTHHWAALVFMASMTAHLVRVFFTGAFRKPRELSWILGVTLLVARHRRRVHRLLAPRRPALGNGAAHHLLRGALDPARRHVAGVPLLRR